MENGTKVILGIIILTLIMTGLLLLAGYFLNKTGDQVPNLENNSIINNSSDEVPIEETPVQEVPQDEDHPRTAYDEQKTKDLEELCKDNINGTYNANDNTCTKDTGEVVDMEGWDYP